jgi:hypothetical protein
VQSGGEIFPFKHAVVSSGTIDEKMMKLHPESIENPKRREWQD